MLCIIDMQIGFRAAQDPGTIENIVTEIKEARHNNEIIVLVEYYDGGEIIKPILDALRGYDLIYNVRKYDDDGSQDILEAVGDDLLEEEVKVCGVNTAYCVFSTVDGLLRSLPSIDITVLRECCYCCEHGCGGWEQYKYIPVNVK